LEVCRLHRQHLQQQQSVTADSQQQQQQQQDGQPAIPAYHEQLLQLLLPGALQADVEQQQDPIVKLATTLNVLHAARQAKYIKEEQQQQQQQQRQRQSWELAVDAVLLPMLLEMALLRLQDCIDVKNAMLFMKEALHHPMHGVEQARLKVLGCLLTQLGPAVLKRSSSSSSSRDWGEPDDADRAQRVAWQLLMIVLDPGMQRSQSRAATHLLSRLAVTTPPMHCSVHMPRSCAALDTCMQAPAPATIRHMLFPRIAQHSRHAQHMTSTL
jgi:hypothetical protein